MSHTVKLQKESKTLWILVLLIAYHSNYGWQKKFWRDLRHSLRTKEVSETFWGDQRPFKGTKDILKGSKYLGGTKGIFGRQKSRGQAILAAFKNRGDKSRNIYNIETRVRSRCH